MWGFAENSILFKFCIYLEKFRYSLNRNSWIIPIVEYWNSLKNSHTQFHFCLIQFWLWQIWHGGQTPHHHSHYETKTSQNSKVLHVLHVGPCTEGESKTFLMIFFKTVLSHVRPVVRRGFIRPNEKKKKKKMCLVPTLTDFARFWNIWPRVMSSPTKMGGGVTFLCI